MGVSNATEILKNINPDDAKYPFLTIAEFS